MKGLLYGKRHSRLGEVPDIPCQTLESSVQEPGEGVRRRVLRLRDIRCTLPQILQGIADHAVDIDIVRKGLIVARLESLLDMIDRIGRGLHPGIDSTQPEKGTQHDRS